MSKIFTAFFAVAFFAATTSSAHAGQVIRVNFSTATLTLEDVSGVPLFSTPVVLPRGNYYAVPVSGNVYRAQMGPVWIPTANMHRDLPGRYKKKYLPYEKGNAMGYCKVSINFKSNNPIMRYVRIHGNAREQDLGRRLSRSCIRIPDETCSTFVSLINQDDTRVEFVR